MITGLPVARPPKPLVPQRHYCWFCGCWMIGSKIAGHGGGKPPGNLRTKEHLQPKSRGGKHGRIVFACYACNTRKADRTLGEYRDWCLAQSDPEVYGLVDGAFFGERVDWRTLQRKEDRMEKVLDECRFDQLTFQRVEIDGDQFIVIKGNWADLRGGGVDIGDKVVAGPMEAADLQRFANPEWDNDLQRARREGFINGWARACGGGSTEGLDKYAAEAFPLRKLRPRQLNTDTISGRSLESGGVSFFIKGPVNGRLSVADLEGLLDLARNPTEWVDDTEPESA